MTLAEGRFLDQVHARLPLIGPRRWEEIESFSLKLEQPGLGGGLMTFFAVMMMNNPDSRQVVSYPTDVKLMPIWSIPW